MPSIVIAIDGFSSCGKSTLAKQLAKSLGYIYVDSGAMYRAVTYYFLQHNIPLDNIEAVNSALAQIHIDFKIEGDKQSIFLNNQNIEKEIRHIQIAQYVSEVATHKAVREWAVHLQQQMGQHKGIVMDGRDIGTTVFPNAALKIFMTASIDVRTQRRFDEMEDDTLSFETIQSNLIERDRIDSTRAISPLTQANDAIVIDNTNMTMDEQFELALDLARQKINA